MTDTETGLSCMGMNTCQPGCQETHATQPSKWTQHRIDRCKNTAAWKRGRAHLPLYSSSVICQHAPLLYKAKQNCSNRGKHSQITAAMQGERQTHATTLQTLTASFYTSMMNMLARAAYTAKCVPKPISRSELSATHTFSFFPPKTASIIFLLLLRASHACGLIGI